MALDTAPAVFVGSLTWDAIALVDHYPHADERQVAREIRYAGGGPAATAAVAAARLGVPSAVVGAVGDDDEGRAILAGLAAEGVLTDGVRVVEGTRSGASVVVVDAGAGTRAISTRPVPPLDLDADTAAGALLRDAAWVHVDHVGWAPVDRWRRREAASFHLSVDAGNPIDGFSADGVDLYAPTTQALRRRYSDLPDDELLDAALREGARTVVATRGGAGALAATAAGDRATAPAHDVDVVSTLGAGDVFHGALLAAVVRDLPLPEALRYANVAAALSCRGLDGRSAIPDHATVRAVVDEPDPTAVPVPLRAEETP
ncbi:MAG: PfkB family carbohydrate kinase [Actinomycetes bacterium]